MPLRVYTPYLDLLHEIDDYSSLQLVRDYHDVGDLEIHLNEYIHGNIDKDYIVTLGDSTHKAGIILSKEIELDESGKGSEEWTYQGPTLQGLMSRRITVPPSGKSYDRITDNAETVMKHYVKRNFVNPDDNKRKIDRLVVAPDKGRGDKITHESRYKNVADELADISKKTGLGWTVYIDFSRRKFVFDVVEGLDLTQSNTDGNNPVFFSPDFGTIKNQSFSDSDLEMANFGYVGGQGEGKDRKIVEIGETTGMNRYESFVDARDVSDEYDEDDDEYDEDADENKRPDWEVEQDLKDRGKEKLADQDNELSLDAEIISPTTRTAYEWQHDGYLQPVQPYGHYERKEQQVTAFVYERDFDLGDTVPVYNRNWGVTMNARITKIKEIHEPGGFRLEATWGKERPTLISKIRDKFDELEGIERQEIPAQIIKEHSKRIDEKLTKEQLERIAQAKENLARAKGYTEEYAEQKFQVGPNPPDNRTKIWVDTSDDDHDVYKRYDFDKGVWKEGPSGPQGIPGPPGDDGTPTYTWIKYADDDAGNGMSDYPEDKEYIGIASNKIEQEESMDSGDYVWSKFVGPKGPRGEQGPEGPRGTRGLQGPKGEQGIKGDTGEDGLPSYAHIAYADDSNGSGFSQDPEGKAYIGMYTDHTAMDSDNPSDYEWSKIKGADGAQGVPGKSGEDGSTPYLHIAYADSSDGSDGFSRTDANEKKYIGTYTDFSKNDSASPEDYHWQKAQGPQGSKGDKGDRGPQGVEGPPGFDGEPRYTWIRYADDKEGNGMSNFPDGKKYIGLSPNQKSPTESTNPDDYTWAKYEGPKGDRGDKGDKGVQGPEGDRGPSGPQGDTGMQGPEGDTGPQGERGPQGPNIVNKDTTFGDKWLLAKHIESLNGLTVGGGQFEVDANGNVKFAGNLSGATGTFSGSVEAAKLDIRNPNITKDGESGLSLQVSQWQADSQQPFVETGKVEFNTGNNGLELLKKDLDGKLENLKYFQVHADSFALYGNLLTDQITLNHENAVNLDQYGNLVAPSSASQSANWNLFNYQGQKLISAYIGIKNHGYESEGIDFAPGGYADYLHLRNLGGGDLSLQGKNKAHLVFKADREEIWARGKNANSWAQFTGQMYEPSKTEFKKDIRDYKESALDVINSIPVKKYKFTDDDLGSADKTSKEFKGAHEVKNNITLASARSTTIKRKPKADVIGMLWEDCPEYMKNSSGLSLGIRQALNWKGIQELSDENDQLKVVISDLTKRIEALENAN